MGEGAGLQVAVDYVGAVFEEELYVGEAYAGGSACVSIERLWFCFGVMRGGTYQ